MIQRDFVKLLIKIFTLFQRSPNIRSKSSAVRAVKQRRAPMCLMGSPMVDALRDMVERFMDYLRADGIVLGEGVDEVVREAVVGIGAF